MRETDRSAMHITQPRVTPALDYIADKLDLQGARDAHARFADLAGDAWNRICFLRCDIDTWARMLVVVGVYDDDRELAAVESY